MVHGQLQFSEPEWGGDDEQTEVTIDGDVSTAGYVEDETGEVLVANVFTSVEIDGENSLGGYRFIQNETDTDLWLVQCAAGGKGVGAGKILRQIREHWVRDDGPDLWRAEFGNHTDQWDEYAGDHRLEPGFMLPQNDQFAISELTASKSASADDYYNWIRMWFTTEPPEF